MVNLFVSYYIDKNPIRQKEIDFCMWHFLNNKAIDKIYVLYDNDEHKISNNPKITWVFSETRTYARFFDLINEVSGPNDINILTNSDIHMHERAIEKIANNLTHDCCFCLTRHEYGRLFHESIGRGSQDTWCFKGRIKKVEDAGFNLGTYGCDGRIAYLLTQAGYKTLNPCLEIFINHIHMSNHRTWQNQPSAPSPWSITPYSYLDGTGIKHFRFLKPERHNKIVSFSLWGNNEIYTNGAIANSLLVKKIYGEDWTARFYISDTSKEVMLKLVENGAELIEMNKPKGWEGLFWRFFALADREAEIVLIRDTDSRVNIRERAAVEEWLASGKKIHVMRDHPHHTYPIMGGMWGARDGGCENIMSLLLEWRKKGHSIHQKNDDQLFLAGMMWRQIRTNCFAHDSQGYNFNFLHAASPPMRANDLA